MSMEVKAKDTRDKTQASAPSNVVVPSAGGCPAGSGRSDPIAPILWRFNSTRSTIAMDRSYLRRLKTPDSDDILNDLTTQQHLLPHQALSQVLVDSAGHIGFCPAAAERAIAWLQ